MPARLSLAFVSLLLPIQAQAQDVASGPEKGAKIPALKVFDATGVHQGTEIDYAAERKDKPTIYLFVNAEKFDRPMHRFIKTLDGAILKDFEGVYVVAIWLTKDADKSKEYLPRVQRSANYAITALTLFAGAAEGPKGWNVNTDAHLTAVIAHKGKAVAVFGYESINETDVPKVKEALSKAIKSH